MVYDNLVLTVACLNECEMSEIFVKCGGKCNMFEEVNVGMDL